MNVTNKIPLNLELWTLEVNNLKTENFHFLALDYRLF